MYHNTAVFSIQPEQVHEKIVTIRLPWEGGATTATRGLSSDEKSGRQFKMNTLCDSIVKHKKP